MKAYRTIAIKECGEVLLPLSKDLFDFVEPHPYVALGAPYGQTSPWMLRKGVLMALETAQKKLAAERPGWKIKLFDAYRPVSVQAFMLEEEYKIQAKLAGFDPKRLTAFERDALTPKVLRLFAPASLNPLTPPPHSTGGALDCTLSDETGRELDMGSPIDENSDRSYPNHFAKSAEPQQKKAHGNREFLVELLEREGFRQNEAEWWHFSKGDQMWVYNEKKINPTYNAPAIYGRFDLVGEKGSLA